MKKTTIEQEIDRLRKENQLLKQLGTRQGFFTYYFSRLPFYNLNKDCFVAVNKKYKELYGENRYEDYDSFRKVLNRTLK